MKEIKLRALGICGTKKDCWCYGYYYKDAYGDSYIRDIDQTAIYLVNENTVGEFTGFKDRDNTEVYEGDIVNQWTKLGYKKTVIRFEEGSGEDVLYYGYEVPNEDCEIIGNIYENPELLKN